MADYIAGPHGALTPAAFTDWNEIFESLDLDKAVAGTFLGCVLIMAAAHD